MFVVAAFYHFFDFPDFAQRRAEMLAELKRLDIKGSVLIAGEGINGTIAGTRESIDSYLRYLKDAIVRGDFEHKESRYDRQPFGRAKVRLKKEIISLGIPTPSPPLPRDAGEGVKHSSSEAVAHSVSCSLSPQGGGLGRGKYVTPIEWNALLNNPEVTVIDARNRYEVHLGTFEKAIDPGTRNFKELPDFVRKHLDPKQHKKIATFCTGGIRCEKFSAWLLDQGFAEVYHLKGGILKYLEDIPQEQSKWQGECYVFDERVAVGHGLVPSSTASMCPACGHALTPADREHALYIEGERCGFCAAEEHHKE